METKIEFYVDSENDVLAVFPETKNGVYVETYAHVGQHNQAHIEYINGLRKATPEEYAELRKELVELVGYQFD